MKKLIEATRYLTLIGIIALLLATVATFGWGAVKTVSAINAIITSSGSDSSISTHLIELVEAFLLAAALLIFAASLYELFIGNLDLPDWMVAHDLHELEVKLGTMIILIMVVKFLQHLEEWEDPSGTLLFGAAIAVISATLIALARFVGKE